MIVFKFTYFNHRHDGETEIAVPGKYEVCEECDGTGTALIPGLRGVAFSAEEMDEDPDFREDYMNGKYDTHCPECKGLRVVLVPDKFRMTKRQRLLWDVTERFRIQYEAEMRHERQLRERGIQW